MNRILIVSIGLLLLVALPVLAEEAPATGAAESGQATSVAGPGAGQDIPAQRIVVMQLEMQGRYSSELRKWLPALLEAKLAEHGFTVLARGDALEAIRQEQNLPGVNPTTAPPQDQLYGASAILKLTARVDVKDYDAAAHIGIFSLGGLVKVKFHLNGQIIDAGTGVIRPLGEITAAKSKLKGIGVVFPSIGYIGGGYKISGIRDSLVGSAADSAAQELVKRLEQGRGDVPGYEAAIPVEQQTIKLAFPADMRPAPGAEYGIYRHDRMIAKVRVIGFEDGLATCRVVAATDQIRSTDVARPLEIIVPVEVSAE